MKLSRNQRLRVLALCLLAGTAAGAFPGGGSRALAQASGQRTELSIPAMPVPRALANLSARAGLQVLYAGSKAYEIMSRPVSGTYAPDEALRIMLAGTGINWRFVGANAVTITVPGEAPASIGAGQQDAGADDGMLLDPIEVTASDRAMSGSGFQGTPDWVYDAPSAVSVVSREAILNAPSRNARDLFDTVAGVYANRSEAQNPGISVNIRGLQDQDRIGMMIDGARQNFQRSGHGSTQRTYVDTAFIREIDIEKSSTSGVGSLGTLGGFVNFRTLEVDDLIAPGRQWGTEINATTGTNAYHFDGSAAAAVRLSDRLSVLGGISYKDIGAYAVGKNGSVDLGTTYDGDTMVFSGQEVMSTILKAEADLTDDMKLTLGWVHNRSAFSTGNYDTMFFEGALLESTQRIANDTFTAALDWDPDSDLIDLKVRFYYNHTKNDDSGTLLLDEGPSNYKMATFGGSIENTSRIDTNLGLLSFNYGAEAFHDDGETTVPSFVENGVDYTDALTGGMPSGKRDVAGGFVNAKLEHDDWLTVEGGLRYDWYRISGNTTIFGNPTRDIISYVLVPGTPPFCNARGCSGGTPDRWDPVYGPEYYPAYAVEVDRSEGAFLPTFTVAVKPYDWLQPFVKYSKSFRPPTIMESFLNSGHAGVANGYSPNPYLEPERADTYEIGANISRDGLFKDNDSFRLKVVGFYRNIEDYIALGSIDNEEANRRYTSYVNLNGTTLMKGVEVEASYDARSWYLGGTFTYNDANWPTTYNANGKIRYLGPETSVLFVQPEIRFVIDGGVRLFDEKLTLGGRVTHVGETDPTIGSLQNNYQLDAYTVYDLYGSYKLTDTTTARFNISNLTDVAYVSALGADYYAMPGRTATFSLNFKY
jgi:hemoglobin/transferrin/lactoferrin receptor protein